MNGYRLLDYIVRTNDEITPSKRDEAIDYLAQLAAQAARIEALTQALEEIKIGFIGSKEMRTIARNALLAASPVVGAGTRAEVDG